MPKRKNENLRLRQGGSSSVSSIPNEDRLDQEDDGHDGPASKKAACKASDGDEQETPNWLLLPNEIWIRCWSLLDNVKHWHIRFVCRQWNQLYGSKFPYRMHSLQFEVRKSYVKLTKGMEPTYSHVWRWRKERPRTINCSFIRLNALLNRIAFTSAAAGSNIDADGSKNRSIHLEFLGDEKKNNAAMDILRQSNLQPENVEICCGERRLRNYSLAPAPNQAKLIAVLERFRSTGKLRGILVHKKDEGKHQRHDLDDGILLPDRELLPNGLDYCLTLKASTNLARIEDKGNMESAGQMNTALIWNALKRWKTLAEEINARENPPNSLGQWCTSWNVFNYGNGEQGRPALVNLDNRLVNTIIRPLNQIFIFDPKPAEEWKMEVGICRLMIMVYLMPKRM